MRGRGHLSSIDKLPDEAAEDVTWACQQLFENKRTVVDIWGEFNERLAEKGLGPIGRTAFYDKSVKLAEAQRRMRESREIFAGLADQFTAEDVDDGTMVLGEMIKGLIRHMIQARSITGLTDSKEVMELARALSSVVGAQKTSSDRRSAIMKEYAAKAAEAVGTVARKEGLSEEGVQEVLAKILNVRTK